MVFLEAQDAIPVVDPKVWNALTLTKDRKKVRGWGMVFRWSLREFAPEDGQYLEALIKSQAASPTAYPLSDADKRHLKERPKVQTLAGAVTVEVPESNDEPRDEGAPTEVSARDSIKMQALLVEIGAKMGFHIWLPRSDKVRVSELLPRTCCRS